MRPMIEELERRDTPSTVTGKDVAAYQAANPALSMRQIYQALFEPVPTPDAGNPHPLNVTIPPKPTDGQAYSLTVDAQGTPSWVVAPPPPVTPAIVWGSVPQGWTPPPAGQPIIAPAGYGLSVDANGVASWVQAPASPPSEPGVFAPMSQAQMQAAAFFAHHNQP